MGDTVDITPDGPQHDWDEDDIESRLRAAWDEVAVALAVRDPVALDGACCMVRRLAYMARRESPPVRVELRCGGRGRPLYVPDETEDDGEV